MMFVGHDVGEGIGEMDVWIVVVSAVVYKKGLCMFLLIDVWLGSKHRAHLDQKRSPRWIASRDRFLSDVGGFRVPSWALSKV